MRVIAGYLGGRHFESPHGHRTHPMSDKVRGAVFNILGDIEGLQILDAYSGSGALAIEAVSRGASRVLAIDSDQAAARTIRENIKELGIAGKVQVIQQNIASWAAAHQKEKFDIVLADPPYDGIRPQQLEALTGNVKPGGLMVLSWPGGAEAPAFNGLELVEHKTYGDAELLFYRRS